MRTIITILVLTFITIFESSAQEINTAKLDSFFNSLEVNNKSMGSFAVSKNGAIVYQRSLGYRLLDKTDSIRANAETQYRIGSITKTFTATMIFQLIDEGKLALDTKLAKFFPQLPNAEKINIENLLMHSSGLMDYVNEISDKSWITKPHPKKELLDTITRRKVNFEPGAKQQYSNSGYLLLGYILEKITGKTYDKSLEQRILKKIGLKSTSASKLNNTGVLEARPYSRANSWENVTDIYFPNVIGVGDILSTPSDLLTFINALTSGKLVSPDSYSKMTDFNEKSIFGRGLVKVPFYNQSGVGHTGGTYGTFSALFSFPSSGFSIASCVNGLNYPINDISIAILSICNNVNFRVPTFKEYSVRTEDLDPYLGVYATAEIPIKITITKNGKSLVAQPTGQEAIPFEAFEKDKFRFDGAGMTLEFNVKKEEMITTQGGRTIIFTKEKK